MSLLKIGQNHAHLLLTLVFLLASLSLLEPVMGWIFIVVLCATVMRLALYLQYQKQPPSLRTLNLLALLSAIVLAYFAWQLGLLLGMINLLVLACALKLMVMRTSKDYFQLVTSCGFLIGCGFIFQQGLVFSLVYLLLVFALILSLALHHSPKLTIQRHLNNSAKMALQALPIAALLFVVLPQIGPLWQMPTSQNTRTGLAEKITPGDIANLSQSSELVFRATFNGDTPPVQARYWRTIVMEHFDGKSWQVSPDRRNVNQQYKRYNSEFTPDLQGAFYEYNIIAEPTHQRWLYGLDIATPLTFNDDQKIWRGHDYQISANTPIVSTFQYALRSYPDVALDQTLFSVDNRINLQTPEQGNPQTQRWVASLKAQYPAQEDFIKAVMRYFREQPFVYTLQPPLMIEDPVDVFLFDAQQGFCSHYASAMTYALRLAGIPARMVTGYQGGETREQYLSVYQYDAHAWVEAWHSGRGWVRYDPTAVVSPERINNGLRAAIANASALIDSPFSLNRYDNIALFKRLRLVLEDIDFVWTKWVLGFDQERQRNLLKSIMGQLTSQKLAIFGVSVMLLIAVMVAVFVLPLRRNPTRNKGPVLYQAALTELSRLGLQKHTHEGPYEFQQRVKRAMSHKIYEPFCALTTAFISHQYRQTDKEAVLALESRMDSRLTEIRQAIRALKS